MASLAFFGEWVNVSVETCWCGCAECWYEVKDVMSSYQMQGCSGWICGKGPPLLAHLLSLDLAARRPSSRLQVTSIMQKVPGVQRLCSVSAQSPLMEGAYWYVTFSVIRPVCPRLMLHGADAMDGVRRSSSEQPRSGVSLRELGQCEPQALWWCHEEWTIVNPSQLCNGHWVLPGSLRLRQSHKSDWQMEVLVLAFS